MDDNELSIRFAYSTVQYGRTGKAQDRWDCQLRDKYGTVVATGHGEDRSAALQMAAMHWAEGYALCPS